MNSRILSIAEISGNHLGSIERAKKLIEAAAKSGAIAVKLQTYTADTMTLDIPEFSVSNEHPLWGGKRLFELYKEASTPWEWHDELFRFARNLGLIAFSTPFDLTAVDFLEDLNVPMYKIASLETGDHLLIQKVAQTGKPILISTGATQLEEIREFVELVNETGNRDLTLLVCTSSYPAFPEDSHLNRILTLKNEFKCKVGLSDHTLGIGASIAAVALGATVIEKHLTLRRSDGGPDGAFSMEPEEFAQLVTECTAASAALGVGEWKVLPSEHESRRLRRSLYICEDVIKGEQVTGENIRAIRPGGGAPPSQIHEFRGKTFKNNYKKGTPASLDYVE